MYRIVNGTLCLIMRTARFIRQAPARAFAVLLLAGCAATGIHMVAAEDMPGSWERRIAAGEMGKADYTSDELKNLDIWPRLSDSGPVNYTPGCADFLRRREEPLEVITRFRVDAAGRVDSLTVMGEAHACRKSTVQMVETFRFLPGKSGQRSLPAVVIYPVSFSLAPEGANGSR